jgi:hypothetical protein
MPEEAVDLGVRRENVLAALAATHAAQHVGLAALLVQVEQARIVKRRPRPLVLAAQQRTHRGRVRLGIAELVELGVAPLPLGRQLLPEALEPLNGPPLVEADVDGVHARAGFCTSRQQCASSMKRLSMLRRICAWSVTRTISDATQRLMR